MRCRLTLSERATEWVIDWLTGGCRCDAASKTHRETRSAVTHRTAAAVATTTSTECRPSLLWPPNMHWVSLCASLTAVNCKISTLETHRPTVSPTRCAATADGTITKRTARKSSSQMWREAEVPITGKRHSWKELAAGCSPHQLGGLRERCKLTTGVWPRCANAS